MSAGERGIKLWALQKPQQSILYVCLSRDLNRRREHVDETKINCLELGLFLLIINLSISRVVFKGLEQLLLKD